jgi:hypothetical protein
MSDTTGDKLAKLAEGLSHATRKNVSFQVVEAIGPTRSCAQIRKDEARLRVALEEITRSTDAEEMALIARRALHV